MPSHFGGESMLGRLLLLFIVVPLVELYLLIEVGSRLGAGTTVILIALTGGVGALLARMQGFRVVLQIRERLRGGQLPADELLSGGLVVAGGLLLVTPGLLTDAVGLALLLPFVRSRVVEWVKGFIQRKIQEGSIDVVAWEGDE
ncbi:MAG: FxsA family protein [candidate division NC10 bacterium]|nr:FxsA family protein [candidate division NC10 bacterium]